MHDCKGNERLSVRKRGEEICGCEIRAEHRPLISKLGEPCLIASPVNSAGSSEKGTGAKQPSERGYSPLLSRRWGRHVASRHRSFNGATFRPHCVTTVALVINYQHSIPSNTHQPHHRQSNHSFSVRKPRSQVSSSRHPTRLAALQFIDTLNQNKS